MAHTPSLSQLQARARVEASRIEARVRSVASDYERYMEQRVRTMTCNSSKPLTQAQLDQLARDGQAYLRSRLR